MEFVLSLQMLDPTALEFTEGCSSESDTCSSCSDDGCTITGME